MANEEQLSILRQGVDVWNKWRDKNPSIEIDLSEAQLSRENYEKVNLSNANLSKANLFMTDFIGANFKDADLRDADLVGARFNGSMFNYGANLQGVNFQGADLRGANLGDTFLEYANFRNANLIGTGFSGTILTGTNFADAIVGSTWFMNTNLSVSNGLDKLQHTMPSYIDIATIKLSNGKMPTVFLRGCNLTDIDIEYTRLSNPDLTNKEIDKILSKIRELSKSKYLQTTHLFVSYSHSDRKFVDKIGGYLTDKGIGFWRDIHDMKAGRIETQIDRAIRQNPTVLLVLSEHSLSSDWVEHEVRTARQLEKDIERDVLCPVALDDSWKSSKWEMRLMEQVKKFNILDFSEWEDDVKFDEMFRKLIAGLELFYKG